MTDQPRRVYRIVRHNPPALADFLSQAALGIPPRNRHPETLRLMAGVSVWATEERAREKAQQFRLGDYLAVMELPADGSISFERTTRSEGHYTLWATTAQLRACVVAVIPVQD